MNTFGQLYRISIFGESHGDLVGVTIDGVKPGMPIDTAIFEHDLSRRRAGARGTTPRVESDVPSIVSGVFNGCSTGAPMTILFRNNNIKPSDYEEFKTIPRPGHADFTASNKFNGYNDTRGGGHFSGRLTTALVAAGCVAKMMLKGVNIEAKIVSIGGSTDFESTVERALAENDSVGGVVECRATGIPVGLGEPFFYSVESAISHLAFSVPAVKGIEFGAGFEAASMIGSQHNDLYIDKSGKTLTNNAGGVSGGISNGNALVFRVVVKPTPSIGKIQHTINLKTGEMSDLKIAGRHDISIALRVPVIIEAITAIALTDLTLCNAAAKNI